MPTKSPNMTRKKIEQIEEIDSKSVLDVVFALKLIIRQMNRSREATKKSLKMAFRFFCDQVKCRTIVRPLGTGSLTL